MYVCGSFHKPSIGKTYKAGSDFRGHMKKEGFALQNLRNNMQTLGGTLLVLHVGVLWAFGWLLLLFCSVSILYWKFVLERFIRRMLWNVFTQTHRAACASWESIEKHNGTHTPEARTMERMQRNTCGTLLVLQGGCCELSDDYCCWVFLYCMGTMYWNAPLEW